ncbi:hypothetical protein F4802DRAFT_501816 [Xylaria palmicola]|nr:hypothetical protein F4802DRAFT_501816 [Xylaria palmicola]
MWEGRPYLFFVLHTLEEPKHRRHCLDSVRRGDPNLAFTATPAATEKSNSVFFFFHSFIVMVLGFISVSPSPPSPPSPPPRASCSLIAARPRTWTGTLFYPSRDLGRTPPDPEDAHAWFNGRASRPPSAAVSAQSVHAVPEEMALIRPSNEARLLDLCNVCQGTE